MRSQTTVQGFYMPADVETNYSATCFTPPLSKKREFEKRAEFISSFDVITQISICVH